MCRIANPPQRTTTGTSVATGFWGISENAVRIQIYVAIITYCTVALIEKTLSLNRSVYEVLRVLSGSLLTKDSIADLFLPEREPVPVMNGQLQLEF